MKKIITLIAIIFLVSCSEKSEEYNPFTGTYILSENQDSVCSGKVFLEFYEGTFNTIWYDTSNCDSNSTQTTARGFTRHNENTIQFNNSSEIGYLRIVDNGSNSYTVCFSDNSSTETNITYSECYTIER